MNFLLVILAYVVSNWLFGHAWPVSFMAMFILIALTIPADGDGMEE